MAKRKKEIERNMEFLVKELKKEWDKTGAVKASVLILSEDVEKVNQAICREIAKKKEEAEGELSFKKCIALCHENYILLRLATKIKAGEEHMNRSDMEMQFTVELDQEEKKLFKAMMLPR